MTALSLAFTIALLRLAADETPESELARYQGTWVLASEEFGGRTVPAEDLAEDLKDLAYTVRGNELHFTARGRDRTATIQLDPTRSPRTYDLVRDDGRRIRGIYRWEDETIKVCSADDEGARPREFKAQAGSKVRIRVWKRKP
jgi:uncharacterized protein (TIGR03067 family)